ncbi:prevent-host-death protein [Methylobacterium sp. NEAU 140]|uniref:type II toxin-antitoxin system Phd/YefM family antitoxin n=1 Tax=Methylobacterium sp. NEAU 140 TaxID=3064945 RepID=UPI0027324804|nr:prevent-host-death protein [Methylobacterium sp. NEAU 140]MDP4023248.1 prevent-host-death protein [Methylobacterium sp. NEAU 140]
MTEIAIETLGCEFDALAQRAEAGEAVTVTRAGRPVLDLVPRPRKPGVDLEAGAAFLRAQGIDNPFPFIADDFDTPLPEDFLLRPLPEP